MSIEDENLKDLTKIAGRPRQNEVYPLFTSPYIQQQAKKKKKKKKNSDDEEDSVLSSSLSSVSSLSSSSGSDKWKGK